MSAKKHLEWGQTPWDNLSREELLQHVQRLYAAVDAAKGALGLMANGGLFWSAEGTGGRALAKVQQAEAQASDGYEAEEIYRCFFRYACDLLFEGVGAGWDICPVCGQMLGATTDGKRVTGERCGNYLPKGCDGIFRPLAWEDLIPRAPNHPRRLRHERR